MIKKPPPTTVFLDSDDDEFQKGSIVKNSAKKKEEITLSSDSDNETPKKKSKKDKIVDKKKKRIGKHVLSDSDEEIPPKKKLTESKQSKKSTDDGNKMSKKQNGKEESSEKTPKGKKLNNESKDGEKKLLKKTDIAEMFSRAPINRVNAPKLKKKKESDFHDDEKFIATLKQLDDKNVGNKSLDDEGTSKRKQRDIEDEKEAKKLKLDDKVESNEKIKTKEDDKQSKKPEEKITVKDKKNDKVEEKLDISKDKNEETKKPKVDVVKKSSKTDKKSQKYELVIEENKKTDKKNETEMELDPFEERIVKKKQHAAAYQSYLHRGGARNPGSKEIPEGAPNCLAGLSFVITGVLDSLERDEADDLIKKYGGRIVTGLSRKVNYLIVGDQAGDSKLSKADTLRIKKITEDELLDLIRSKPAGKACNIIPSKPRKNVEKTHEDLDTSLYIPKESPQEKEKTSSTSSSSSASETPIKNDKNKIENNVFEKKESMIKKESPKIIVDKKPDEKIVDKNQERKIDIPFVPIDALVEKYRPKTMKQIIGQQTDKSNAKKFHWWLKNWHKNQSNKSIKLTKPSPFARNDDGAYFKACLLSGPPGIGKTTTVQVVCKELGFDLLEFNASDTRSKRLLKDQISTILSNKTAKDYFSTDSSTPDKMSLKHVLLMDEVDGMSGNEDRGGLQELIALIKSTDIPIICICNDRGNQKMRTLTNYTFELKFSKPKLEQIRGAMMSLCFAEKIKITKDDIDKLIEMSNYDIRQVINYLAMRVGDDLSGTNDKKLTNKNNKDEKLTPWTVVEKVFNAEEHKTMTIHDKSSLFFNDYSMASLFVQENYLSITPNAPKNETLTRIAESADSLSMGDVVEKTIRSRDGWSLLPLQACYSSVIPGSLMSGKALGRMNFPSWLGRNSTARKFDRLLQEITSHSRLVTGASKEAITIDYLKPLRDAVIRPLAINGSDGVDCAVETMIHYHLLKDDFDGLVECSLWPGSRDPMQSIEPKIKAAFTRMYNKKASMPYKIGDAPKKKTVQASEEFDFGSEDDADEVDDEQADDNLEKDRMIKVKKTTSGASTSKGQSKTARGRGRGRGRGK